MPLRAVVTGGTRGIGGGIAEALAQDGFDLLLSFNSNEAAAEEKAAQLRSKYGIEVHLVGGDVAQAETCERIMAAVDTHFGGKLDCLIHNAGQYLGITSTNALGLNAAAEKPTLASGALLKENSSQLAVDTSQLDYYLDMYPKAFVRLCEAAVPRLNDETGRIVAISSPGCNLMQRATVAYGLPGSGKSSMEYIARVYAKALAPRRITVNVVIPGIIETDAWKKLSSSMGLGDSLDIMNDIVQSSVPMKRSATALEVGQVVAFLCSSRAAYITGVLLPIDGGSTL